MSRERVKSKNLFNFRPQGFIDPVVLSQDVLIDPVAMEEHMKNQSEAEFAAEMRGFMDSFKATPFKTDPAYVEVEEVLAIVTTYISRRTPLATILSWKFQPSTMESTM